MRFHSAPEATTSWMSSSGMSAGSLNRPSMMNPDIAGGLFISYGPIGPISAKVRT